VQILTIFFIEIIVKLHTYPRKIKKEKKRKEKELFHLLWQYGSGSAGPAQNRPFPQIRPAKTLNLHIIFGFRFSFLQTLRVAIFQNPGDPTRPTAHRVN
jgi:hypothetical protein